MEKMKLHFDTVPFDDEERETMATLDEAFEEGGLVSHLTTERQTELQEAARNTLNPPKKHISARLPERDLAGLKPVAGPYGIRTKTLVSTFLIRYVDGRIDDRD